MTSIATVQPFSVAGRINSSYEIKQRMPFHCLDGNSIIILLTVYPLSLCKVFISSRSKLSELGVMFTCRVTSLTVASPEFVGSRGKDGNYVMGHYTVDFRAGCSSCSVTNSL